MRSLTSQTSLRLFKIMAVIFGLVGASMILSVAANGCGSPRAVQGDRQDVPGLAERASR